MAAVAFQPLVNVKPIGDLIAEVSGKWETILQMPPEWRPDKRRNTTEEKISDLLKGALFAAYNLSCCGCEQAPHTKRTFLQVVSVRKMEAACVDKLQPITVVSVGAEGCLEEAELVLRLHRVGYRDVTLILVDPSEETFSAAGMLTTAAAGSWLAVKHFNKLEEYAVAAKETPEHHRPPQLLFLVDLESTTIKGDQRDAKFNWRTSLTNHSFHFLRAQNLLRVGTVVTFTSFYRGTVGVIDDNMGKPGYDDYLDYLVEDLQDSEPPSVWVG